MKPIGSFEVLEVNVDRQESGVSFYIAPLTTSQIPSQKEILAARVKRQGFSCDTTSRTVNTLWQEIGESGGIKKEDT